CARGLHCDDALRRACASRTSGSPRVDSMIPKTIRRSAITIALLVVPVGASASAQSTDSVAVRAAMSEFLDALNALDVARMSADFADDITAFVPSAQVDRVEGKAA